MSEVSLTWLKHERKPKNRYPDDRRGCAFEKALRELRETIKEERQ